MPRTVLITGANRGIGFETAKELAAAGFRVFIGAREGRAGAEAAAKIGRNAEPLVIDVSDSASIASAAELFAAKNDRLDVLVNNAGIYPDKNVSILNVSRELLVQTFQTNTFGPVLVTQSFLPFLRKSRGARIVNISSGYGQLGGLSPGVPGYCLSKLALNGATIMLAKALETEGIAVNSVCPGWVRTDM